MLLHKSSGSGSSSLPQDVFTHLLSIAMLYVSIISLLVLLFQYINELFPDPLEYIRGAEASAVHGATASVVIAFPVFLLTSWLILRGIRSSPEKAHLWVRRWLLSLTLFIAAVTIICDLIVLIHNFLNGDLTMRFLLKVFVILLLASCVFAYELWDLRRHEFSSSSLPRMAGWLSGGTVVLSVLVGFLVVGSPMYQRNVRFDERRVNDLQTIQTQIESYWTNKIALPSTLADLNYSLSSFSAPLDPLSLQPYEYRVTGTRDFELCATFVTDSHDRRSTQRYDAFGKTWEHGIGKTCFARSIDPSISRPKPLYPSVP